MLKSGSASGLARGDRRTIVVRWSRGSPLRSGSAGQAAPRGGQVPWARVGFVVALTCGQTRLCSWWMMMAVCRLRPGRCCRATAGTRRRPAFRRRVVADLGRGPCWVRVGGSGRRSQRATCGSPRLATRSPAVRSLGVCPVRPGGQRCGPARGPHANPVQPVARRALCRHAGTSGRLAGHLSFNDLREGHRGSALPWSLVLHSSLR
jgi:hypothetical protein